MDRNQYEALKVMKETDTKKIELVRDAISQKLFVLLTIKDVHVYDLYQQLQRHPHPNMVCIYECTRQEDTMLVLEEFVNGVSLTYKQSTMVWTCQEIDRIMLQLFHVLHHVHTLDPPIIHRDVKPENVFLVHDEVKLLDFDIARTYKKGQERDTRLMGSVGFASPEHYGFMQCDARSDIYSLGALLQDMLDHAIQGDDVKERRKIAQRCMKLDPNDRFANVQHLQDAYMRIINKHERKNVSSQYQKRVQTTLWGHWVSYVLYFAFVLYLAASLQSQEATTAYELGSMRVCVFLSFLLPFYFCSHFSSNRKRIIFLRSKHLFIRICCGVVLWFLSLFILFCIAQIIEQVVHVLA